LTYHQFVTPFGRTNWVRSFPAVSQHKFIRSLWSHKFGARCLFAQRVSRVVGKTDSVTSKASGEMSKANVAFDLPSICYSLWSHKLG